MIKIYTDGACSENPGPGGWAVTFNNKKEIKELSGYEVKTTNNRMELTAIVEAMENIIDDTLDRYYSLYSDSAYVINSINNKWVDKWQKNGWETTRGEEIKNVDLWLRFIEARKCLRRMRVDITFLKVKGHSGDTFNEYVDKLAKEEVKKARKEIGQYD